MKKIFILTTIYLTAVSIYCNSILLWGVGARSFGMGRVYTAICEDVTSIYYNPAGLSKLRKFEFLGNYSFLYENIPYAFLGVSGPTKFGSGAFGIVDLNSGNIQGKDIEGKPTTDFSSRETLLILGFGSNLTDIIYPNEFMSYSTGLNLKLFKKTIFELSGSAIDLDFGHLVVLNFGLYKAMFGLNIQNLLQSKMKFFIEEEKPTSFRISSGVCMFNKLNLGVEILKSKNFDELGLGVEYELWNILSLRSGINNREIAVGLGITRGDMQINYSVVVHRFWNEINLGIIHTFDIKIKWVI